MDFLLESIRKSISKNQCIILFAAGKDISVIENDFIDEVPDLSAMPNSSTYVGVGASAISAGKYVTSDVVRAAEKL